MPFVSGSTPWNQGHRMPADACLAKLIERSRKYYLQNKEKIQEKRIKRAQSHSSEGVGSADIYTGAPCKKYGHTKRYVKNGNCVECVRFQNRSEKARESVRIASRNRRWGKGGVKNPTRPMPMNCECCGAPRSGKRLHLDHCHQTKAFRGWLCFKCNSAIGQLGDSAEGVSKALAYLKRSIQ
jgi:hypothetical protein